MTSGKYATWDNAVDQNNDIITQMLRYVPLCYRSFLTMLLVAMEISCALSGNYHSFNYCVIIVTRCLSSNQSIPK